MNISIPKPCHEEWAAMLPNEHGRHCNICCKTVVDFTDLSDEQVKHFFINKKKGESVCGRFKTAQLQRIKIQLPSNIYTISMPLWKRFLTACLLAFSSMLFSCDSIVGETETVCDLVLPQQAQQVMPIKEHGTIDTIAQPRCSTIIGDTVSVEPIAQGEVSITPVENIILEEAVPTTEEPRNTQIILTGKVAFDTSNSINPDAVDTVVRAIKKPSDCGSDFINL